MLKSFISIYEPIMVEFDGVKYPIKKLNRARFREFIELQKQAEAASPEERIDFGYRLVSIYLNAPQEVIDDLHFKQVQKLASWMVGHITGMAEEAEEDPEKNGPRPGDETPPA